MTLFPLELFNAHICLVDGDKNRQLTYGDVKTESEKIASLLRKEKSLIFLFCQNLMEDVIAYIGAMNAGHVVCLLDSEMPDAFRFKLIEIYKPLYLIENGEPKQKSQQGYLSIFSDLISIEQLEKFEETPKLHDKLKLLLTTSGTTGNPKLIRLSNDNLISNAKSIIEYLKITSNERAIASLPFHYSYGLSVLHTHLLAGASIVLTKSSVVQDNFWEHVRKFKCTSFAGVPYLYKLMDRVGFDKMDLPDLKNMTQAGGALDKPLILKFHEIMKKKGGHFFTMYGQTEATARISYLPPSMLPKKAGSIGIAIPQGVLSLVQGELVYEGPNVMLGYAREPSDLAKGDELKGKLFTGDLGYFDEDHIFYLSGRLKRISKVYGLRINLDDIEKELNQFGAVAVTSVDNQIDIFIEQNELDISEKCVEHLSVLYKLNRGAFKTHVLTSLPRTSSGKVDYAKL